MLNWEPYVGLQPEGHFKQDNSQKALVLLASSIYFDDVIDATTGDDMKPELVSSYYLTKGGVDTLLRGVNELCATYGAARSIHKWPMVILFSLLKVAGVNSQIIYIVNNPSTTNICRQYLKELGLGLNI